MTVIVPPGEGHLLTARGSVMAFKAVAAQTGGDFSLMERTLPPGGRIPSAHRHTNCSEAFFTSSPPPARLLASSFVPCAVATDRAIARPSPAPEWTRGHSDITRDLQPAPGPAL